MTAKIISILLISTLYGAVLCRHKPPTCNSQGEELWPHNDVNKYWFCAELNAQPLELNCPPGAGFIRSNTQHGCVPYHYWECANQAVEPNCWNPEHYDRPQRHEDPNMFWACSEDRKAVPLKCESGRGFTDNGMTDPQKPFGCVDWPVWDYPRCVGATFRN